uniref:Uncharacterized protein n=1 Tax=Cajanus cajan TaxID=3821 RepID=A0A151TYU7_CAJCA|nr:hypothetical protein KK1_004742 [Cajanus cajan]
MGHPIRVRIMIRNVDFSMNGTSAPRPDGFGGNFYHFFGTLLRWMSLTWCCNFFKQIWILPSLNSNLRALIPKFQRVEKIGDYIPFAFTNFQFKIITKVLGDRLASIAPKIVSVLQRGFIQVIKFHIVFVPFCRL